MYFIYGVILSLICGISSPIAKKLLLRINTSQYFLLSSFVNLIFYIVFFKVVMHKTMSVGFFGNLSFGTIVFLIVYLALRIASNTSQTKLTADKTIDINIIVLTLSQTSIFSILASFVLKGKFYPVVLLGVVISVIGVVITTVDFSCMKFYFNKYATILLIIAFYASGTKPLMGNALLEQISVEWLCLLEGINYVATYWLIHRKEIRTLKTVRIKEHAMVLLLAIFSTLALFLQYIIFSDVIISIITAVLGPVFTVIASYLLLKEKLTKKTAVGMTIILMGAALAKLAY